MSVTKVELVQSLSFGERVAELERDTLSDYFVETDQWRKVYSGEADVIFGNKGAGKSALYAALMDKENELFDRGVILVSAENPRGDTAFSGIVPEPPPTEFAFTSLWKSYVISLVGSQVRDLGLVGPAAKDLLDALIADGMLPKRGASLQARLKMAWSWVRERFQIEEVEGGVKFDPATQLPVGLTGKIRLREPEPEDRQAGARSVDDLFALANEALEFNELEIWVLFDRLDVAFPDTPGLEENALRALFKVYLSLSQFERIRFKVFLRSDIWSSITGQGFREASHITRQVHIEWKRDSLRSLVVSRVSLNKLLMQYYGVDRHDLLSSASEQERLLLRMFPEKVDVGRNPETFDWALSRVRDGTKASAPREVIHLFTEARNSQVAMFERGESEPPEDQIISRAAFREALAPVSSARLIQTLLPEFPHLKDRIMAFEGKKTDWSLPNLAALWAVDEADAEGFAQELVDVGLLELRESAGARRYWIPFLYRPALDSTQGAAED